MSGYEGRYELWLQTVKEREGGREGGKESIQDNAVKPDTQHGLTYICHIMTRATILRDY
jgi:hypothetical protein